LTKLPGVDRGGVQLQVNLTANNIIMKCITIVKAISCSAIVLCCQSSMGQSVVGFWEVEEVKVAGKVMTPVAKWFRVNMDGTFQSGNGWLQSAEGTWQFDKTHNTYLPTERNGLVDKYGAFKVMFEGSQMSWERMEDGDQVLVRLKRIEELPKSPADRLVGVWDLKEMTRGGKSEKSTFDPEDNYYIFIRWDRIYVERAKDGGKSFGYWHINGHRPELTLISQMDEKPREIWNVEVDDKTLKLNGISESNKALQMVFEKINHIPD
jgi:hypothetical protein